MSETASALLRLLLQARQKSRAAKIQQQKAGTESNSNKQDPTVQVVAPTRKKTGSEKSVYP